MRMSLALLAGALALAAASASPVLAQKPESAAAFPSRPIRLIVPYPPGGATDTVARRIGDKLRSRINATVVVDNRPGANPIIGTEHLVRAPADGYTLLLNAPAGIVQAPWLQSKLPYDALKDIQPIIMIAWVPTALIVPTSVPAGNFSEFTRYLKSNTGKLSFASLGLGSTQHIYGEMLTSALGVEAAHVPYKGDAPAMTDLVAARVQFMFNNPLSAINFSKQGKVRVLAVTGSQRVSGLPDTPTMGEAGLPGFELVGWFSIFAPAGVPRPIAEKLHTELAQAIRSPDITEFLTQQGLLPDTMSLDAFTRQVKSDYAAWGKVIKAHNIRMD